jgi:vitamin B12 transporter
MRHIPVIIFHIFLLLLLPSACCYAYDDSDSGIELEPITISLDTPYLNNTSLAKNAAIINPRAEDILSIDTLLARRSGIDVSQRGTFNTQSDISIRGAGFEQSVISVNSIVLNDPQTGHYNLDLAMPLSALYDITVITGQSTEVWAQSGIGGAVNMRTKRPLKTESNAYVLYGSDNTQKISAYASSANKKNGLNIAFEESSSKGFRPGTDFRQFSVSSSAIAKTGDKLSSYIFLGYGEKEFSASNFYSPYDSKEWTDTMFLNLEAVFEQGPFRLSPSAYYRRHHDKFMLDKNKPDFYLNHHRTDIKGVLLNSQADMDVYGLLKACLDINEQSIRSSKLGTHSRKRLSYSAIWENHSNTQFGYDISARIDDYSEYDTQCLPMAGAYFMPSDNVKVRAQAGKSSRMPSYTELFYQDPSNMGNSALVPETAISYEAGLDFFKKKSHGFDISITVFKRDMDNMIDWIKYQSSDSFYRAENITKAHSEGLEAEIRADISNVFKLLLGYSYVDTRVKDSGYVSKYALDYPCHKVFSQADIVLPFGRQEINIIYKDKKEYTSYFILGCCLRYDINKNTGMFLNIDNIFDIAYWDIRDNTLPGRQVMAGIKAEF